MRPGDHYQSCLEYALGREMQEHAVAAALRNRSNEQQIRYLRKRLLEAGNIDHDEACCRLARLLMRAMQDSVLLPHTEMHQLREERAVRQLSAGLDVEEALCNASTMCGREAGALLARLPQSTQGKVSRLVSQDEYDTVKVRVSTLVETKQLLYKQVAVGWKDTGDIEVECELARHLLSYQPLTSEEWQQIESMLREWMQYSPGSEKLFRLLALVREPAVNKKFNERAVRFFAKAVGRFASVAEIGACAALLSAALDRRPNFYPFGEVVALGCVEMDKIAQLGETVASLRKKLYTALGDTQAIGLDHEPVRLTWSKEVFPSDVGSHESDFLGRCLEQARVWRRDNPSAPVIECVIELRSRFAASGDEPLLRQAERV